MAFKTAKGLRTIETWKRQIETVSAISEPIAKAQAKETVRLIKKQFRTSRDPYGTPWKRKQRPDGRKILIGKTKKLRKYRVVNTSAKGFAVGTDAPHERFHQGGTKFMDPRPIRPDSRGLPPTWSKAYRTIALFWFKKHFR